MTDPLVYIDPNRIEVYSDRDAWAAGRRTGEYRIGASMVGRILTRPWEAFADLTGQAPEHDAATLRAFARGHRWERMVLDEYRETRDVPALPAAEAAGHPAGSLAIVVHPRERWATCSPDAFTVDPRQPTHDAAPLPGVVECKTDAGGQGWADADCEIDTVNDYREDMAPAGYLTQSYWLMECTGLPFVDLVCLLPRYALRVVRVWSDPDTQAEILDAVGDFRERYLLRGEALPVDGSDACRRLLARRFPGAGKDLRAATPDEAAMVVRYADAKARVKAAEAEADEARNRIAEALGDTYGLSLGGKAKAILCPVAGRRTLDAEALRAAHPDIAAAFERIGEPSRQLRIYGI